MLRPIVDQCRRASPPESSQRPRSSPIVQCGSGSAPAGQFDFDLHALKRIDYIGSRSARCRPEEVRAIIAGSMRADLWGPVEAATEPAESTDFPARSRSPGPRH